ncbi:mechanosensitive ion channel family protein [Frankia sp. AgB32]|uniref:mechanosensitive ion channel family protein n=1 Tax=Frankia sp. AgB32 TaxID=631119 RepID=UPI00201068D8|nr:mechanosensitive ion channel family protein [Frankia sp. AgB32]MCK9893011.1 mechanosensitive ion channel [Frankia sp. AgB32]
MQSTIAVLTVLAGAVIVALAAAVLTDRVARRIGQHSRIVADLAHRGRRPVRLTLVLIALQIALGSTHEQDWTAPTEHVCGILLVAGIAWCVVVLAFVLEELALARYRVDVVDNRHARRIRTQVSLLRRITVAVIAVIAAASMLMTIPSVRVAGASIFASAGVVGIVAGLAAQTSLANVFAGLQIAFTDAMRVDDVVVVEEEWGRIEEITLTYVVVHIWDDRRMILPSTYFTTKPFQNWTRKESAVLGAVELDLDWEVPIEEMRAEMHRVLEATDLWDRRVSVLQVTDAVEDHIRIRVLVSGKDGPTTFDLRCHMREALVLWLQRHHPTALPRTRVEFDAAAHLFGAGTEFTAGHRPDHRANGARHAGADDGRDGRGLGTLIRERDDTAADRLRKRGGSPDWEPITTVTLSPRKGPGSSADAPPAQRTPQAPAAAGRGDAGRPGPSVPPPDATEDARLFSGASPDSAQRARDFSETPADPDDEDPGERSGDRDIRADDAQADDIRGGGTDGSTEPR